MQMSKIMTIISVDVRCRISCIFPNFQTPITYIAEIAQPFTVPHPWTPIRIPRRSTKPARSSETVAPESPVSNYPHQISHSFHLFYPCSLLFIAFFCAIEHGGSIQTTTHGPVARRARNWGREQIELKITSVRRAATSPSRTLPARM